MIGCLDFDSALVKCLQTFEPLAVFVRNVHDARKCRVGLSQ